MFRSVFSSTLIFVSHVFLFVLTTLYFWVPSSLCWLLSCPVARTKSGHVFQESQSIPSKWAAWRSVRELWLRSTKIMFASQTAPNDERNFIHCRHNNNKQDSGHDFCCDLKDWGRDLASGPTEDTLLGQLFSLLLQERERESDALDRWAWRQGNTL